MAIVISDTNDKRKKVDLKLGKVALSPTIQAQSGPATRVQDISPIVKQGEQFLNNFNNLTKVYGQAVDVFTEKGKEEAKNLDEAGFQDALKNISGDSFSLFGKTKAFNEGLVERYFATEVPLALQKIDEEMQADITQYGSLDKFQEATAQRLDTYFDSLGEQFDENVFTNRALGAYSSVVKQKMLLSSNEKYLEKIDAFNTEEANNKAYREINSLTSAVDVSHVVEGKSGLQRSLELIDTKNAEILTDPSERNKASTGAVFGKITNAIDSGDFTYADSILDLIEDEEFSVNGKQIFNTAEAGLRVEELRAKYDTALKKYEREQLPIDISRGTNSTILNITSAIRLEGEDAGIELANSYLDEIAKTGSVTIGDETYTDPSVVGAIQKEIRAATFNPQVFVKLADDRLMDATSQGVTDYLKGKNGILNEKQIKGLIAETAELEHINASAFYLEGTNDLNETITIGISTDLSEIVADVETYSNELLQEIIDTIPADITQPNDKAQYVKDQIEERDIRGLLKQRLIDNIKSNVPVEKENTTKEVDQELKDLGVPETTINAISNTAEKEEYLRHKQSEGSDYNIANGKVEVDGFYYSTYLEGFQDATENDAWVDSENKLDKHEKLIKKADFMGRSDSRISSEIVKITDGDLGDKIEGYQSVYDTHLSVLGADSNELINGYQFSSSSEYHFLNYNVKIGNLMNRLGISFSDFGIRLGDKKASFRNTIKAIEAFENDFTVDPAMQAIADKYGVDVSVLYAQQREYFEQNGYLK